jgi:hypothetical protein
MIGESDTLCEVSFESPLRRCNFYISINNNSEIKFPIKGVNIRFGIFHFTLSFLSNSFFSLFVKVDKNSFSGSLSPTRNVNQQKLCNISVDTESASNIPTFVI